MLTDEKLVFKKLCCESLLSKCLLLCSGSFLGNLFASRGVWIGGLAMFLILAVSTAVTRNLPELPGKNVGLLLELEGDGEEPVDEVSCGFDSETRET